MCLALLLTYFSVVLAGGCTSGNGASSESCMSLIMFFCLGFYSLVMVTMCCL